MKIICSYGEREELMQVIAAGCSWIGTTKDNFVPLKSATYLLMEKNIEWEISDTEEKESHVKHWVDLPPRTNTRQK